MSISPSELTRLLSTVAELRKEVHLLRGEVLTLEGRVIELESKQALSSETEFELVDTRSLGGSSSVGARAIGGLVGKASPDRETLPLERISAAQDIGKFLRRCLSGQPRGASGRSRIAAPSAVYIVCQSFDLEVFDPPKVFFTWGEAKPWVIRNGSPGQSIFVGLPTPNEAKIAIEAAGCEVPAALLHR